MKGFESLIGIHQDGEADFWFEEIGIHLSEGSNLVALRSFNEPQLIFRAPMYLGFDFLGLFHITPDTQYTFEVMNGVGKSFLLCNCQLVRR